MSEQVLSFEEIKEKAKAVDWDEESNKDWLCNSTPNSTQLLDLQLDLNTDRPLEKHVAVTVRGRRVVISH